MPAIKNQTGNGLRTDETSAATTATRSLRAASILTAALAGLLPITGSVSAITTNPTLVQIGIADLQKVNPSINGTGVTVAQVEASAGYYNPPGDPYACIVVVDAAC